MRYTTLLFVFIFTLLMAGCQPIQPVEDGAGNDDATGLTEIIDKILADPDGLLPVDPQIRIGQLENGLTYYIRENSEPENRAELRLAINAGSLLEDEDQLGVAHFLEHMLFNGTEKFEGQAITEFLESVGMNFGADLNARTSFDETVYILRIPTDDSEIVETAFTILEEWAAYATFPEDEIDKERGVVYQEWQSRQQNAGGRLQEQILPVYLGGSRYNDRLPIGDMEIVQNAQRDVFVRFYETWYRPDLMAVVAVGDFDMDEIEGLIQERFSSIEMPDEPTPRPTYELPEHDETRYLVATDPENTTTLVRLSYRQPAAPSGSANDYRTVLMSSLIYDMFGFRLDEMSRQADAPFVGAFAGRGGLVRAAELSSFGAQVQDDGVEAGLNALVTEVERVRRHGFTESELERAKTGVLRYYEQAYDERDNADSGRLAEEFIRNYLTDETIPGIAVEYGLVDAMMPTITVEEINETVATLISDENRSVIVTAPEKEDVALPDEDGLAGIIEEVMASAIDPYVDEVVEGVLMETLPEPVEIVEESSVPELGVTEIVLANGVRVLMKPTDFMEEEVVFLATSPGGSSLVPDEDYPEAGTITAVVSESGVGSFDQTALLKLLAGKSLSVSPYIDDLNEGFTGQAATEDLETLFQMIHLYVTEPRADEEIFEVFRNQVRAELENRLLSPFSALQDAWYESLYSSSIREMPLSLEVIEGLDLARGFEIYQERFADLGDFTFVFVGNFEIETLSALSQRYLGTLPTTDRDEKWQNLLDDPPSGVIDRSVYKGQEGQSIALVVFHGLADDASQEKRVLVRALADVLDIEVRDTLREELGGTYSSGAFASMEKLPDQRYLVGINFGSDPERVEELLDALFAEIDDLKANGPDSETLATVQEQTLRSREEMFESNGFWTQVIQFYVEHEDEEMTEMIQYNEYVEALTVEDIQEAAQVYLSDEQFIQIVLYPEQ